MRPPTTGLPIACAAGILCLAGCSSQPPERTGNAAPPAEPVRITQFYASPPNPPRGERSLICYGTENATDVKLEPPIERVWPSPSHCFEVVPKGPATYTLIAERGSERVTQTIKLSVGVPPPEIISVNIDAQEVPPGTLMHVCYKARNAASVTVTPGEWVGNHTPETGCVQLVMKTTTVFKVRARDASGDIIDGEDAEVRVK